MTPAKFSKEDFRPMTKADKSVIIALLESLKILAEQATDEQDVKDALERIQGVLADS